MNFFTIISIFFLWVLSIASLALSLMSLWDQYLPDLSVYYKSVTLLSQNKNPYLNNELFTQIIYPPSALMLMNFLSYFPFGVVSNIWTSLSIIAFLASIICLYFARPSSPILLSLIVLGAVVSFPFKFNLGMGQINLILLLLISAFLLSVIKKMYF